MNSSAQPNFKSHFAEILRTALGDMIPSGLDVDIEFLTPKQVSHGDYSCNLAMQLAKPLRRSPRDIAASLADALMASPYLEKVEIAGAGFINLFLTTSVKQRFPQYVLKGGAAFGHVDVGAGKKYRWSSCRPTLPVHCT